MLREYVMRLQGIRFRANMGASSSERAIPQEVVVDVDLTLPITALPRRDHKQDVVDYDAVATLVVEEALNVQHRLLETYAQRVVERLLERTPAVRVRVAATKLRVPTRHSVDRAVVELVADRVPAQK
jgi:7,8-dihydroneopterin aldolase/epimerase/oxygenase